MWRQNTEDLKRSELVAAQSGINHPHSKMTICCILSVNSYVVEKEIKITRNEIQSKAITKKNQNTITKPCDNEFVQKP